jgi:UDP-N-acetylmuramyl pentapeptide phosphotransferase/UDP-N-acetylglucosamine-1-phosphate transferase
MTIAIFLGVLLVAFVTSALACFIAMVLFPWFRSGERKEGAFRPDQSTGSYRIHTGKHKVRIARAGSSELPAVGGPAIIAGVIAATVVAALNLNLGVVQWEMLGVLLFAMMGFGVVGFVDDWRKVHMGEGISEIQKFAGVLLVSLVAGIALNRLLAYPAVPKALSARLAYPPYSDFPLLGRLLTEVKYAWIVFFLLMTATVTTATSLAVDFSDGMDGLCGGLMFSASLSLSAILLSEGGTSLWPATIAVLAIAGATAGFLPFNWPSSWKARTQGANRRARIIMGDTGSLALGGLLALVAIISRLEFVLVFIGGVFVLEGLSALISARILVRFFRKFLRLERYNSSGRGFLHTEFPLPFLATPMHHHYDLLGWDRKRLVYGAWLLGTGLGVLGVASVIGTFTWQRYLARFAALLVIACVWQTGHWTRSFFIGLHRPVADVEPASNRLPALGLYYGFPFRLFGRRLYGEVDTTSITPEAFHSPAEKLFLWQRMSIFDARSVLGYYCYREGAFDDALRIWGRIPKGNLEKRPDIAEMLAEVRHSVALRTETEFETHGLLGSAQEDHWYSPAFASAPSNALAKLDPSATAPAVKISAAAPPEPHPEEEPPPAELLSSETGLSGFSNRLAVVPVLTPNDDGSSSAARAGGAGASIAPSSSNGKMA